MTSETFSSTDLIDVTPNDVLVSLFLNSIENNKAQRPIHREEVIDFQPVGRSTIVVTYLITDPLMNETEKTHVWDVSELLK